MTKRKDNIIRCTVLVIMFLCVWVIISQGQERVLIMEVMSDAEWTAKQDSIGKAMFQEYQAEKAKQDSIKQVRKDKAIQVVTMPFRFTWYVVKTIAYPFRKIWEWWK